MHQNCQITRCARQHTMDSVLKSAKLRAYVATWQETEMASRMRDRPCAAAFHQSWMSFSVTNSRIAFQITNISTQYKYKIGFGPMVVSTCKLHLYEEICRSSRQLPFFGWCWSECDVTYGILAMAVIVCWQSEDCAESKSEPNVWKTPD